MAEAKTLTLEDAKLIFRNFSGKEGQYNNEGDRSFCVILDPGTAKVMLDDGWNIRELPAREEGDEPVPYVNVKVNFKGRPPKIVMLTSTQRTILNESSVEVLDWADIRMADLIIRGFDWSVNGKSGTKAYLQSLYVTIEEDDLDRKYAVHDNYGDDE